MTTKKSQLLATYLMGTFLMVGCATIPIEDTQNTDERVLITEATVDEERESAKAVESDTRTVSETAAKTRPVEAVQSVPGESKAKSAIRMKGKEKTKPMADSGRKKPVIVERMDLPDAELTSSEIASYLVVIRPNDFLGKIAKREYNNYKIWRSIYEWNRDLIGDDPNIIYPYNELTLFKPAFEITRPSHDYIVHEVAKGETLWSIAKDWYGDNLAWKLVHSDNKEILNSNGGRLVIGMELKIRTGFNQPSISEDILSSVGNN